MHDHEETEGLTLSELGKLLEQHFSPSPPRTPRKRPDSIYAQALLPTVDCAGLSIDDLNDKSSLAKAGSPVSDEIKLLYQYAAKSSPVDAVNGRDETPEVVDRKGKKTARVLAAQAKQRKEVKANEARLRLLQRVERRVLCSHNILPAVLKATGCKYIYAGDSVSGSGDQLAIYYRCAQAEQEDETTCSGSMRIVLPLNASVCRPHPLFASADRAPLTPSTGSSRITKFYGSASKLNSVTRARAEPVPTVVAKIRLTHLTKHARTYVQQKDYILQQRKERRTSVKKLERLLHKLQKEVETAKSSERLEDVSTLLEKMEDLVEDSASEEESGEEAVINLEESADSAQAAPPATQQERVANSAAKQLPMQTRSQSDRAGKRKRADSSSSSAPEIVPVTRELHSNRQQKGPAESSEEATDYDEPDYSAISRVSSARARKNTSRWAGGFSPSETWTVTKPGARIAATAVGRVAKKRRMA